MDYKKENERQFKEAKAFIGFPLRGINKYYNANQCRIFKDNIGLVQIGRTGEYTNNISFNEYSINLGPTPYHSDYKRFANKNEMFGFVAGYNQANGWN
jgi:hypothetical protein